MCKQPWQLHRHAIAYKRSRQPQQTAKQQLELQVQQLRPKLQQREVQLLAVLQTARLVLWQLRSPLQRLPVQQQFQLEL